MADASSSPDISFGSKASRIAAKELFSWKFAAISANRDSSVLRNLVDFSSLGQGISQAPKSDGFIEGYVEVLCSANCCIFLTKSLSVRHKNICSLHTNGFLLLITAKPVDTSILGNGSLTMPK